jgi:putative flavoprotein involved in K+ transport
VASDVDVAVIGAGQAGLATSYFLKQAGVEHVVFEAGRVAETWRTRRWDSFCLVTPNWTVRLPGAPYDGAEPDGYMNREELVDHFERWAASFGPPVEEQTPVSELRPDGGGFVLDLPGRRLHARTVVVASGGYQRPYRPAAASDMPAGITQLLAEEYTNETALPAGNVLIVGSGQTGCQIAEELHQAGRKVMLACGRAPWVPRRMGGHDVVWWMIESGFWDRTIAQLPTPAARLFSNPLTTGHGGGHDLHYRTLHAAGVELLGRYAGADGRKVHFADDLGQSIEFGDNLARGFLKWVMALCEKRGLDVPWEIPGAPGFTSRAELDVDAEGITTVIWTTGFRPDYGWIKAGVFDAMGFPVQTEGASAVPGLYFMGVHFQRKAQSAVLYGVGEDAQVVVDDIVSNRR